MDDIGKPILVLLSLAVLVCAFLFPLRDDAWWKRSGRNTRKDDAG